MSDPILAALLDAIAAQLRHVRSLDLTQTRAAESWFQRHGIAVDFEPMQPADGGYDLILLDLDQIELIERFPSQDDGLLLVRVPLDPSSQPQRALEWPKKLDALADIRTTDCAWHLLRYASQSQTRVRDLSLVLVTQDNENRLIPLLIDFAAQEVSIQWELIIVDRESYDRSGQLIDALEGDVSSLRLPRSASEFQAALAGVRTATGQLTIIARPDDLPLSGWLVRMAKHIEAGDVLSCKLPGRSTATVALPIAFRNVLVDASPTGDANASLEDLLRLLETLVAQGRTKEAAHNPISNLVVSPKPDNASVAASASAKAAGMDFDPGQSADDES